LRDEIDRSRGTTLIIRVVMPGYMHQKGVVSG
jgi:hypothetical protein